MAYDEQFKERFDALQKAGYMQVYSNMTKAMRAPFWWSSKSGKQSAQVEGNGTVCFINTGTRHIGAHRRPRLRWISRGEGSAV